MVSFFVFLNSICYCITMNTVIIASPYKDDYTEKSTIEISVWNKFQGCLVISQWGKHEFLDMVVYVSDDYWGATLNPTERRNFVDSNTGRREYHIIVSYPENNQADEIGVMREMPWNKYEVILPRFVQQQKKNSVYCEFTPIRRIEREIQSSLRVVQRTKKSSDGILRRKNQHPVLWVPEIKDGATISGSYLDAKWRVSAMTFGLKVLKKISFKTYLLLDGEQRKHLFFDPVMNSFHITNEWDSISHGQYFKILDITQSSKIDQ